MSQNKNGTHSLETRFFIKGLDTVSFLAREQEKAAHHKKERHTHTSEAVDNVTGPPGSCPKQRCIAGVTRNAVEQDNQKGRKASQQINVCVSGRMRSLAVLFGYHIGLRITHRQCLLPPLGIIIKRFILRKH